MVGATKEPPSFPNCIASYFSGFPQLLKEYNALSKIKVEYPWAIPSSTDTHRPLSHILVNMVSFKDEIFGCIWAIAATLFRQSTGCGEMAGSRAWGQDSPGRGPELFGKVDGGPCGPRRPLGYWVSERLAGDSLNCSMSSLNWRTSKSRQGN